MTVRFDLLMVIGLCMLPGAFIVGFLLALAFSRQEIGSMVIGGIATAAVFVSGLAVFLVGLGQELH